MHCDTLHRCLFNLINCIIFPKWFSIMCIRGKVLPSGQWVSTLNPAISAMLHLRAYAKVKPHTARCLCTMILLKGALWHLNICKFKEESVSWLNVPLLSEFSDWLLGTGSQIKDTFSLCTGKMALKHNFVFDYQPFLACVWAEAEVDYGFCLKECRKYIPKHIYGHIQ